MTGILTAVITLIILSTLGIGLNELWKQGFWPVVVAFTPAVFAIAYAASPNHEQAEFRRNLAYYITCQWLRRR